MDNLTDALMGDSGGASSDSSTPTTAPPAPETTSIPISGDLTPPAQPTVPSLQAPPPPAGQQSVWKNIVMGALTGLAGSAGATHFGGGAAAGASAVLQQKQRDIENQMRQKQIEFESARAADTHIAALDEHRRADQLADEHKLDYAKKSAEYQAFLQDNFGIEPNLSFNDQTSEATGAMNTLAQMNGGQYPPVSAVHQPSPDGEHGKVAVYSPSQQQMRQNANGFRDLINTQRAVQGQPPIDDATFNSLGFKGQRDAAQGAINFLKPTPGFSMDKNKPDYLPAVLAQRQQQLAQYQQHRDENGKLDANPNVEQQLGASITYLQNAWDSVNKSENKAAADAITATAPAKANAAAQSEIAKNTGAAGQSQIDIAAGKKKAEQAANSVYGVVTDANGVEHTQMMTSEQAQQAGATAIRPVKQADISKDQHDIKVLNDIQVKSNVVQRTATALDGKSLSDVAGISRYLADNPNTAFSSLANAAVFSNASTQAQAYIIAINSLRESSMGLQKVLTGTARTNETQLHALLNTLPGYEPNSRLAIQKIAAFNQNLSMLAEGLPENTGVKLLVPRGQGQSQPGGAITVTDPNGTVHTFPDQQSADKFKKLAGIR